MTDVIATRDNLVDRLRDSGLRVVTDLRDANPPCVLVAPETLEMAFGGVYGSTYSVSFIAPDVGFDRAQVNIGGPQVGRRDTRPARDRRAYRVHDAR